MKMAGLLLFVLPFVCGCGGSGLREFPVAETSGMVLCEGKPVPFAKVFFNPKKNSESKSAEVGKPGFAFADKDGRFVLSTYGEGDGAIIGKHEVTATPDPGHPCNCWSDDITVLMEVEVKAGQQNEFTINVPLLSAGRKPPVDPDADPE
ncbi:MAG UNVERIFIED_CONTAM: hypothetical protein LVR18_27635 [Planctomycetaceae bacterium]